MIDIKNVVSSKLNTSIGKYERLVRMKGQMDTKAAAYLRYLGTKNQVNRASDYHYLMLAVTQSTAPVNNIDYINPKVKPAVDYVTADRVLNDWVNCRPKYEYVRNSMNEQVLVPVKEECYTKM